MLKIHVPKQQNLEFVLHKNELSIKKRYYIGNRNVILWSLPLVWAFNKVIYPKINSR